MTYIPPVAALIIGVLFAHEPMRALDRLAMACIPGGVYLLQSGRDPKNAAPAASAARRVA
ncbi:hypothetical protein AB4Y32_07220 [Paraburkholderia phymatum]|uniref:Uncharacterized protein n=1 Tax=Paraburkholderia phymatum TaxID=148447 RepID=A0ACC6TVZ1_9BURK